MWGKNYQAGGIMFSICEVCERAGMAAHTLRYYEKGGFLPGAIRNKGDFRRYYDEDMDTWFCEVDWDVPNL